MLHPFYWIQAQIKFQIKGKHFFALLLVSHPVSSVWGASQTSAEEAHGDSFKGTGGFLAKHNFMSLCSLNKYGLWRLKHHMLSILSCLQSSFWEGASLPRCHGHVGCSAVTLSLGLPRCLLSHVGRGCTKCPYSYPVLPQGGAARVEQLYTGTRSLCSPFHQMVSGPCSGAGQWQQLREHDNATESLNYE